MDGAWRSLVARLLREQEVGGSNPLAPIPDISILDMWSGDNVAWVWHDESLV